MRTHSSVFQQTFNKAKIKDTITWQNTEIFMVFMSTVKSASAGGWEAALFRDVELVGFLITSENFLNSKL